MVREKEKPAESNGGTLDNKRLSSDLYPHYTTGFDFCALFSPKVVRK